MEYSPKKMQEKMDENNFGLKKKFGQNFIIDENIINGIVNRAEIDDETLVLQKKLRMYCVMKLIQHLKIF